MNDHTGKAEHESNVNPRHGDARGRARDEQRLPRIKNNQRTKFRAKLL